MQNRAISNWQVTASSQWNANHAAIQGRLFYPAAGSKQGAWSARTNDVNQWLQINLSCNDNIVTRVATQGRNAGNQWVTKYMLQYSTDGVHFQYYKLQGQAQNKVNLDPYKRILKERRQNILNRFSQHRKFLVNRIGT